MKQARHKTNILISACLLGEAVRYNATDLLINHPLLTQWQQDERLISICPEVAGGMSIPRDPAEIMTDHTHAKVIDTMGKDVTPQFMAGAKKALKLAQTNHCIAAILTERSPSCGSHQIYDGSFSGTIIQGMGVTTTLLEQNGIKVFNQHQLIQLDQFLNSPYEHRK